MKTALITTTINIPEVLTLYRALDPSVQIFVAGDKKTPHEAGDFVQSMDNATYVGIESQYYSKYKSSELIGWDTIGRRNIALLEALKWGAEIIITIDDDNIPVKEDYFYIFTSLFDPNRYVGSDLFTGIEMRSVFHWFDPGQLLVPPVKHRGYPSIPSHHARVTHVTDAKVGVAEGLILGDTDVDAATRIAGFPLVHSVSDLGRAGIVTDPRHTRTVFNTQNTAFLRDLAPAMFCMPHLGRFDDIYASLITQRVMAERNLYVHFGQPLVYQQRNPHNLITDLRQEIDGMEHVKQFADALFRAPIKGESVIDDCRVLIQGFNNTGILSDHAIEAAMAFYEDCEAVL